MKQEDFCRQYHRELARSQQRLTELQENGGEALSRYDREIASGGNDERALHISTWLVGNSIADVTERLTQCDEPVQQITRFDVSLVPNTPSSA